MGANDADGQGLDQLFYRYFKVDGQEGHFRIQQFHLVFLRQGFGSHPDDVIEDTVSGFDFFRRLIFDVDAAFQPVNHGRNMVDQHPVKMVVPSKINTR